MDREALKKELQRDEGVHFIAYKDSLGYWTIGVGHLLGGSPRMSEITPDECAALLDYDISTATRVASKAVGTVCFEQLADARQRALVNMAFNLGGRLLEFHHFVGAVIAGDWKAAGEHMEQSDWWKQVGERAVRLRKLIEEGT